LSEFHYVRTHGPDGGVDAAEGSAIGLDLEAVLDSGLPPLNIAIQIIAGVAEILAIGAEDNRVHGNLDLGDVFIDDTGAVSIEGFGQTTTAAPESKPVGPETDRYGLGMIGFALFSPRDLPELPNSPAEHENAAIDAILALNLETLPEEIIGDIQWYLARLLAWEPADRPDALEAWRAFGSMVELVDGPQFAAWCNAAIDGGGERRDEDEASRPMSRGPLGALEDTTVTGGPMPRGAVNFDTGFEDKARSTASWTRQGMKTALQRVLSSDYLQDPSTDWMPGTPIPTMDRQTHPGSQSSRWSNEAVPKRAPGEAARRKGGPGADPISRPLPSDFDDAPEVDDHTEHSNLVVPTHKPPTPVPQPIRRFKPPADSPTIPAPVSAVRAPTPPPTRPRRTGPAPDPNTAPEFVPRPKPAEPAANEPPPEAPEESPPQDQGPPAFNEPIPDFVQRGPDPFAEAESEDTGGSNGLIIGGIAFVLVISFVFCAGVGGVGGIAALIGMPTGEPGAAAPKPRTRIVQAEPSPEPEVAVAQTPKPGKRRPVRPTPRPPRTSPSPRTGPTQPTPVQPSTVQPSTVQPSRVPVPSPYPSSYETPQPSPSPSLPPLPLGDDDSILPYLVPEPSPNPDGSGPSMLQNSMRAHLSTATAARNAVIAGKPQAARDAARSLEFLNPENSIPPDWLPYVVDLKMEAWLLENSPDLPSAGFKVAQIGQACAACHAGLRAGPVVTPSAVPQRVFPQKDVMKRHAWAVDWMWVGLLANDQTAWAKGASELSNSPFASVILDEYPEQKFMDLEDKLHSLAADGEAATTPDKRTLVFGKLLATCSRCHRVYRKDD